MDIQMLQHTDDNNLSKKSLKMRIHHNDHVREFEYENIAEKILKELDKRDWIVVSMNNDF